MDEYAQEVWRDIIGYEGRYQVSNLGRVKRLRYEYVDTYKSGRHRVKPERIVTASVAKMGYYMVDLHLNGRRKRCYVHRLVAQSFVPNPDNLFYVNHKDENMLNNRADNLEWCTAAYNVSYGTNRVRSVETRRKNGTYENISDVTRRRISDALKGKKKSLSHRQHISEGRKKLYAQGYRSQCKKDG